MEKQINVVDSLLYAQVLFVHIVPMVTWQTEVRATSFVYLEHILASGRILLERYYSRNTTPFPKDRERKCTRRWYVTFILAIVG